MLRNVILGIAIGGRQGLLGTPHGKLLSPASLPSRILDDSRILTKLGRQGSISCYFGPQLWTSSMLTWILQHSILEEKEIKLGDIILPKPCDPGQITLFLSLNRQYLELYQMEIEILIVPSFFSGIQRCKGKHQVNLSNRKPSINTFYLNLYYFEKQATFSNYTSKHRRERRENAH